jgi:hypothetical protein
MNAWTSYANGLLLLVIGAICPSWAKKGRFRVVGDTLFFNDDAHPAERDVTGK